MTVNIQGKGGSGMPKIFLNGFDVVSGADSGNGVTVPEIVESCFWSPDGSSQLFERTIDGWFCKVLTDIVGEDQIIWIAL